MSNYHLHCCRPGTKEILPGTEGEGELPNSAALSTQDAIARVISALAEMVPPESMDVWLCRNGEWLCCFSLHLTQIELPAATPLTTH